eukprot:TRINITY_DN6625_c0_g1_i1.p1 TRINITY_DN6625_c0_g1~~TRINITY_DN6625_c0_g1_i1.p1  ORF type:complete len:638 (+),score=135.45 TRINITY_DN6625_c0_g1_i1:56-1969(+)
METSFFSARGTTTPSVGNGLMALSFFASREDDDTSLFPQLRSFSPKALIYEEELKALEELELSQITRPRSPARRRKIVSTQKPITSPMEEKGLSSQYKKRHIYFEGSSVVDGDNQDDVSQDESRYYHSKQKQRLGEMDSFERKSPAQSLSMLQRRMSNLEINASSRMTVPNMSGILDSSGFVEKSEKKLMGYNLDILDGPAHNQTAPELPHFGLESPIRPSYDSSDEHIVSAAAKPLRSRVPISGVSSQDSVAPIISETSETVVTPRLHSVPTDSTFSDIFQKIERLSDPKQLEDANKLKHHEAIRREAELKRIAKEKEEKEEKERKELEAKRKAEAEAQQAAAESARKAQLEAQAQATKVVSLQKFWPDSTRTSKLLSDYSADPAIQQAKSQIDGLWDSFLKTASLDDRGISSFAALINTIISNGLVSSNKKALLYLYHKIVDQVVSKWVPVQILGNRYQVNPLARYMAQLCSKIPEFRDLLLLRLVPDMMRPTPANVKALGSDECPKVWTMGHFLGSLLIAPPFARSYGITTPAMLWMFLSQMHATLSPEKFGIALGICEIGCVVLVTEYRRQAVKLVMALRQRGEDFRAQIPGMLRKNLENVAHRMMDPNKAPKPSAPTQQAIDSAAKFANTYQ